MAVSLRHQTMIDLVVMLADLWDVPKEQFSIRGVITKRRPWGFHLAKSEIYGPDGMGDRDYSVKQPRNKRAVSEYSAGFDINVGGKREREVVAHLVEMARTGKDKVNGKSLLFEVIGPDKDGKAMRWGVRTGWKPVPARADHDWHVHISFWRDQEEADKRPLFFGYFGIQQYPALIEEPEEPEHPEEPEEPVEPPAGGGGGEQPEPDNCEEDLAEANTLLEAIHQSIGEYLEGVE